LDCEHGNIQHLCPTCFYKCEICDISLCGLHHNKVYKESDYLEALDIVYREEGVEALKFQRLKELRLYYPLYKFGWNAEKICHLYGMTTHEWKNAVKLTRNTTSGQLDWNEEMVWKVWDQLVDKYGYVPTANEVRQELPKFASIFGYMTEYSITFDMIRAKYPNQKYGPNFGQMSHPIARNMKSGIKNRARWTESVNGMRWHSRAEASASNFLYARGISHRKGKLYADEYAEQSDYARGWYDIHFESPITGNTIDMEIWGNLGEEYAKKRLAKETFNKINPNFFGMDWEDCNEIGLTKALESYIGIIEPFIFDKPEHKIIQTAFWSDAPEIIETCRWLAEQQPDGIFPTEHWLRKRGIYADRDGETYNTLGVYIQKYVGGLLKLRNILGEDTSHYHRWNKDSISVALDEWMQEYGISPAAYITRHRIHNNLDSITNNYAGSLASAVTKYLGTFGKAMKTLGYSQKNRVSKWEKGVSHKIWTRESTLIALDEWVQKYRISPEAYYSRHKIINNLDDATVQYSKTLYLASRNHIGKNSDAMKILGYSKKHHQAEWKKL